MMHKLPTTVFLLFVGRYPDSVAKYQKSVKDMLNDSFPFNTRLML